MKGLQGWPESCQGDRALAITLADKMEIQAGRTNLLSAPQRKLRGGNQCRKTFLGGQKGLFLSSVLSYGHWAQKQCSEPHGMQSATEKL